MFNKGIQTDIIPKLQPKDSYRFALNAVLESSEGNRGSLPNELGNKLSFTTDSTIVGHCQLDDDTIVLFLVGKSSEIGIFDPTSNTYTSLLIEDCLNFSTEYPVFCLFRIREGCKRALYFTDRNNPYRTITIEDIDSYYENDVFDCSRIELNPSYQVPQLNITQVFDNGGSLKVGSYQFAVRYLDADLNPTNWFYVTSPVTIYDEAQSSNYFDIDGAIPIFENAEAEEGAVPQTSKAIKLELSNIDTSFVYYQVAAIHNTSTIGRVSETWILEENYINDTTATYVYGGPNVSLGHFQGDLSDIIVDDQVIDVVQHHAQKDNYLILGGFKSQQYDYSAFQKEATNIVINWKTDTIFNIPPTFSDNTEEGNPKNPLTQYNHRSLMGDEVYAIGIQYRIKNKYWTPTFHIPGRAATSFDRTLISYNLNQHHLPVQDKYELWQERNTAQSDGTMGYFECSSSYPDIRDCNNERIFPEGPIRHHKMPGRDLVPIYTTGGINVLGITASNISFPHPDVTGYRIMVSIRDESNSTSIESALLTRAYPGRGLTTSNTDDSYQQPFFFGDVQWEPRIDTKAAMLFSPQFYIDRNPSNFDYLKINNNIDTSTNNRIQFEGVTYSREGGGNFDIRTNLTEFFNDPEGSVVINRNVVTSIKVDSRSEQPIIGSFDFPLSNTSYSNPQHFIWLEDNLGEAGYKIVTKKKYIPNVYSNLSSIRYRPLDHNIQTASTFTSFNGDVYISEFKLADIWAISDPANNRTLVNTHYLNKIWLESPINFDLIHPGTDICNSRYVQGTRFGDYFIHKVAEEQDNSNFVERTTPCEEFYGYNRDYSKINIEDVSFSLPINFDYCSGCINEYPYRIRYSKQSFQEEISDNYRIFLEGDYRDLDGSTGPINSMFVDKDQLYVLTTKAPWFIPTKPQQVLTDESVAYLGTGERFAIPPKKMATNYYGGCRDTNSLSSTPFGTIYVSEREGKVFHLSDKLDEISGINRNWFEENLPLSMSKAYREQLSLEYPLRDSVTHLNGIGIIVTYDPRFRRVIIHKKDYKPLYPLSTTGTYNTLRYNDADQNFYFTDGGEDRIISIKDPNFFENKSWTHSYSLADQAWISFHSYLPQYMFNDDHTYYSTNEEGVWTHGLGPYQTYYNTKYPWIIDKIINPNPQLSHVFQSIEIVGNFQKWNSIAHFYEDVDNVFDNVVFYSDKQSSGFQSIILKDESNPFESINDFVIMQRVDDEYQLSNIRNYVTSDGPVFSSSWEDIQSQYFIDKVPNNSIINNDRSMFNADRIRGEWMGVRLYSNTSDNIKITMELINTNSKYSFR